MPPVREVMVAFVVGLAAASFVAWRLAINFRMLDEFDLIGLALTLFAASVSLALAVVCRAGGSEGVLGVSVLGFAIFALCFSGLPPWMDAVDARSTNPFPSSHRDAQIVLEFLIPALTADVIIWQLMLRYWRIARGADARTLWPWLSIAFGAAVILNPFGLAVLSSALAQSSTDWFAGLWLLVSAGAAVLLLTLAFIERAVRARILRRSSVQAEA